MITAILWFLVVLSRFKAPRLWSAQPFHSALPSPLHLLCHQVLSFGGVNVVAYSSHYAQSIAMTAGDAFALMTTIALGLAAA